MKCVSDRVAVTRILASTGISRHLSNEALMVVCSAEGVVDRGKVGKQLVLVLLVVLQITMAPVILFSLTYLAQADYEAAQGSIRTDLIHRVVSAGLTYGLISRLWPLCGGIQTVLRCKPRRHTARIEHESQTGDPELVDRARLYLQGTP